MFESGGGKERLGEGVGGREGEYIFTQTEIEGSEKQQELERCQDACAGGSSF